MKLRQLDVRTLHLKMQTELLVRNELYLDAACWSDRGVAVSLSCDMVSYVRPGRLIMKWKTCVIE